MQMIEISKLIPHPRNQEFFDDIESGKWEDFKNSIKRRNVVEPITVTQDLVIVSGHQRVRACSELGILEIPCKITYYPERDEQTGNPQEDLILEDLISTNILQRGIGNVNPMKMAKCIIELERIYKIKKGGDGSNQYSNKELNRDNLVLANPEDQKNYNHPAKQKTQADLANDIGVSQRQLQDYKTLIDLIPELQDMVSSNELSATVAYKIWAKLSPEQQKNMFDEIGKDTIADLTQKATSELMKQLEEERKEKQKLIELNTDLLTREYEIEQLQERISTMKKELSDRPTVETEVVPEDYQDIKNKLSSTNKDYAWLNKEYQQKVNEIDALKKQIESLKCVSEEEQYAKKLKDGAIFFCARVNDFIEKTGGFVWLSENINELPDYERKSYIKAIEMVENWAFAMKANMKNYL